MSETVSKFVWYDLMTSDIKAAETFYSQVVGWDIKDSGMPDRTYMLLSMGATMIGGLMPIPEHAAGAPPVWMGYIGVPDVDAYSEKVRAAGGAIHRAAEDIPGDRPLRRGRRSAGRVVHPVQRNGRCTRASGDGYTRPCRLA